MFSLKDVEMNCTKTNKITIQKIFFFVGVSKTFEINKQTAVCAFVSYLIGFLCAQLGKRLKGNKNV